MSAAMVQFVFRPNPGSNISTVLEFAKEAAGLWRRQGADVQLWAVQVGEIGNWAFIARFDSTEKLGKALDGLNADPAFQNWRARGLASGLFTWVRSNQGFEVPV